MNNEYLTCEELAELLKLNKYVVQRWARENKIPSYKIGSGEKRITYRFKKEEVLEVFRNKTEDNNIA